MRTTSTRRRSAVLLGFVALTAVALVARLADLQVLRPERYVEWGVSQRFQTVELAGSRGDLIDRNGEELAVSIPRPTVWADPRLVTDPSGEAEELAATLGVSERYLEDRLASDKHFVYLARAVEPDVAAAVAELELDGVFTDIEEAKRFNPSGEELATSVIGEVGIDNAGLSGIEFQYDEILSGAPGELVLEQDPDGRTIPTGARELVPPRRGADVVVSLDRSLQFEAEQQLVAQVEEMQADGGVVIISEPSTGEILAMANVTRDDDGAAVPTSENMAVTWTYEPGSVMKALTFSAVLDQGLATPETPRTVNHWLNLHDATFVDHWEYGEATFTVDEIVTNSSNTGTISWALDLGEERLHEYLTRFGLGSSTGLDFKGETPGLLPAVDDWSGTTIGTVAIGNGVAVTPLQLLSAYNVIANGGVYVPPTLVLEAVDADGERIPVEREPSQRVIAQRTARDMAGMLANVVAEGTGTAAAVEGYAVAGKTGTARKPQPNGGYLDEAGNFHYVANFVGFFPAEDPQLSMIVIIDEPKTSIFGGAAAAPLFAELAHFSLRRLRIPPPAEVTELAAAPTGAAAPASAPADGQGE